MIEFFHKRLYRGKQQDSSELLMFLGAETVSTNLCMANVASMNYLLSCLQVSIHLLPLGDQREEKKT